MSSNTISELGLLGDEHRVLLDKPFSIVYYFNDLNLGFVYWKKAVSFQEYQETFNTLLQWHLDQPIDYFISDIVNQGVSTAEMKEWFKQIILKKAIKAGLKKGAVIINNNPFKEFYINIILKTTNSMGLPLKTFHDLNSAKNWLVS